MRTALSPAEQITLAKTDVTVDVGKTAVLKATVQPANTDNKNLVWTSTDTGVATVNAEGRVKGIALGECQIICASKTNPEVTAAATIHVQQPVTKVVTDKTIQVYAGESTRLTWRIEPANASNQTMKFTSSSSKIVTVAQDGTITGVKHGEAYVTVAATDGSEKSARIKVSVIEHVTGVHMLRKVAYINVNETATAGAQLEPKTAGNNRMSWYSMNPGIASVSGDKTKATRRLPDFVRGKGRRVEQGPEDHRRDDQRKGTSAHQREEYEHRPEHHEGYAGD